MEKWKRMEEVPYMEVSNYGRFRSVDRVIEKNKNGVLIKTKYKGKIRKTSTDNNGYQKLIVPVNGVYKGFVAHRLVAKYFLKDFDPELEVDHIDDNRSNNNVSNLRMLTRLENMRKPSTLRKVKEYLKGLTKEEKTRRFEKTKETMKQNGSKFGRKKKPVVKIGYNSVEFIDDIYILDGFSSNCIRAACNGKYGSKKNTHYYKGSKWYFQDDYIKMLGK